jgi:hypothetical protein
VCAVAHTALPKMKRMINTGFETGGVLGIHGFRRRVSKGRGPGNSSGLLLFVALTRPHAIRPPGDGAADFRIIICGVYYARLRS